MASHNKLPCKNNALESLERKNTAANNCSLRQVGIVDNLHHKVAVEGDIVMHHKEVGEEDLLEIQVVDLEANN